MFQYTIVCADTVSEQGVFKLATTVVLSAKDDKTALSKAKKLIKKKIYWIHTIREQEEDCLDYQDKLFAMQENMFKEIVKAIKAIK